VLIFIITSVIPSVTNSLIQTHNSPTQNDVNALLWAKKTPKKNSTIISSVDEIYTVSYFSERKNWLLVGLFSCLASATRIFGILLFVVFLLVYLADRKFNLKKIDKKLLFILLAPLGLVFYIIFLQIKFGDPFIFLKAQKEWANWGAFTVPWRTLPRQFRLLFDFNLLKNISVSAYFAHFRVFFLLA